MAEASPYRSARLRVTAVSAAVVFVVLAIAGWAVTTAHRAALRNNLVETLERAGADLADALENGRPLTTIGFGDDDAAYQVIDGDGEVLAASANLDGAAPIAPDPGSDRAVVRELDAIQGDEATYLVRSSIGPQRSVIHVAAPTDDVEESAAALRRAFTAAVPLTAAVLAAALLGLVGRLLRRAESASERQRRFVADASHELRNPLTRMRTELEVDLAHPSQADPLATHRLVLYETVALQHLVDDLLQLARLDGSPIPEAPLVPVDLDAIVERVAADLRAEGRVAVDTTAVEPVQVAGRTDQLRRVVANLAENAARYAQTSVRFEVGQRDGAAFVAVSDDGPGIPAEDRERVFERFSRMDSSRTGATGGTGLGLAIARAIAVDHGGTVGVDPAYSAGTRMVVTLPL